jgi:hypothetical protein
MTPYCKGMPGSNGPPAGAPQAPAKAAARACRGPESTYQGLPGPYEHPPGLKGPLLPQRAPTSTHAHEPSIASLKSCSNFHRAVLGVAKALVHVEVQFGMSYLRMDCYACSWLGHRWILPHQTNAHQKMPRGYRLGRGTPQSADISWLCWASQQTHHHDVTSASRNLGLILLLHEHVPCSAIGEFLSASVPCVMIQAHSLEMSRMIARVRGTAVGR